MPNAVYDDEDQARTNPSSTDDLSAPKTPGETDVSKLEDDFAKEAPKEAVDAENKAIDTAKSFYKGDKDGESGFSNKAKGYLGNIANKKILPWFLGPLVIIILLFFVMGALKLPNYAANIASYRFARSAMEYARTSAEIDSTKVAIETADDAKYSALKDKYTSLRSATWGKLDKYRPEKVYQNLKGDGTITYETRVEKKFGIETRTKITAIRINGERIPVESPTFKQKFGSPLSTYRDQVKMKLAIEARVSDALKGSNTLVRSSVAKKIRADLGIKLRFWEKGAKNYSGLKPSEADQLLLKESVEKETVKPTGKAATSSVNEAVDKVDEAMKECIDDPDCAKEIVDGDNPEQVTKALSEATDEGIAKKALAVVSPAYAIVVPACMIYDGSIDHASDTIDAQTASAIKSFNADQTKAQQQQMGDTAAEAVAAANRKIGSGNSVPDQYMSGATLDTSVEKSPQASATGDFTIIDALVPNAQVAGALNTVGDKACPTLTSVGFNIAAALGFAVVGVLTGGTSSVGGEAAAQGIRGVISLTLKKAFVSGVEKIATVEGRQQLKGFSKKFARDFIGIEATTALAKMLVLSRAGLVNNGATSQGESAINIADMGATAENNQYMQQMMYASPMTNDATQTVDKDATQLIAAKDALSPGLGRYFGTTSPLTKLRNRTAINVAKIKQSGLVTAFSSFNISSIALTLFPQSPAHADSANSNWGIVQWGWTTEEQRLIDSNQTYSVLQNDEYLSDTINATIESEYGKCFTNSMGTLLKDGDIKRTDTGDVVKTGTTCSPESLGPNNPKYGDKVFRWRLSKKRQAVLDHNLEMQNPTEDSATPNPSGDGSSAGANATAAEVLAQCKNNTATGKVKIVCSSLTLMGIPYGAMGTAGYLTKNPPVVGCNSYTNISIMRATAGKYKGEYCSQTYENEGVKDGNFKKIPLSEVAPGDIVIRESSCGCTSECGGNGADSQGRFGHVAIVVSYDKATDKLVASEATGHSKPSGISDPKTATWSSSNIYGFTYGMVYTGGGL